MAGITTKTRGCATCRGRRIKCDLQKPSCNNCVRSGRTCQGYERHDVFVNRTAAGMQKRRRLEEVKDQRLEEIKNALVSGAFSQAMVAPAPSPDDHVHWFYRHFVISRTDPRLTQFMSPVMQITTPGPLLTSSLRALSIMKFGRAIHDIAAEQQGQKLYGRSLGKLRLALTDATASKSDETLACAVVLGLFELLNVHPKYQSGGWFKHMVGLGRLIEHRGPKQSQSPVCLAIFEVCRNVLVDDTLSPRSQQFGFCPSRMVISAMARKNKNTRRKDMRLRLPRCLFN
ncbi:hypothetical protein EJ05DRAFT_285230 [Pseudovirgaria hyperparasitica]|uniref:Zn(2)-C6 fungal-type domain-containing protein n=1 Tax=Pseudovirgaria hyperparasitica TaxID=470096 RepID=A0A6A6WH23_9PEZI|nr:uncharacterized protein EJ05DRAFT_285230 [Pseudovirgaria hyperparasitica]KAF2760451.1 hypothetical protein EJ05DRAFT_285230 [Pseudovirgaria hyperparasitica]